MPPYRIALLGCGTVGREVLHLLTDPDTGHSGPRSEARPIEVRAIVVRDPSLPRDLPEEIEAPLTDDPLAVCRADDIDLIVEVAGGVDAPAEWIRTSLEHGKDVVTANKAVLAERGGELFALARKHGRQLLFEASVAGALPLLHALEGGLPAGKIEDITGILNGTCNHVLEELGRGASFENAVIHAQAAGLAEADPTLDLAGTDAAHKIALVAQLMTGAAVDLDRIRCEGIEAVQPIDLAYGRSHGWTLKLLAVFRPRNGGAAIGVYPAWIDAHSPLASVRDEYNGVSITSPVYGSLLFVGKGAGGRATAGSVVADIFRAARSDGGAPAPESGEAAPMELPPLEILDPFEEPARYHLRFLVADRPGVLAQIAGALGSLGISIAAAEQPSASPPHVPIHITTHPVVAERLDRALAAIIASGVVAAPPLRIRVEAGGVQPAQVDDESATK